MAQSIRVNWSFARRSWATLGYPDGPTDMQRWYSNMMRDSLTPQMAARHFETVAEFDSRPVLQGVPAPTLVLANSGAQDSEIASIRVVASHIPNARLVTLDGDWAKQFVDPSHVLAAMRNFLDEPAAEAEAKS